MRPADLFPSRWFWPTLVSAMAPLILVGDPPWLLVVFLAVMVAWAAGRGWSKTPFRWPSSPFVIPMLLAGGLALAHLSASPNPYYSLHALFRTLAALLFYFLILDSGPGRSGAVLVFWFGMESAVSLVQIARGDVQPVGTFGSPNLLATFFLALAAYGGGMIATARPGPPGLKRSVPWLAAVAGSYLALMTGSRSAAMAVVLVWLGPLVCGRLRQKAAVAAVVAVLLLLPNLSRQRLVETPAGDPYAFTRLQIWEMAVSMGQSHPLIGVGPDLFGDHAPRYAFPVQTVPARYGRLARRPHSDYLRIWAEGGAVGVAALLLLSGLLIRLSPGAWRGGRAGPVLAVAVVLFQSLFHDLTDHFGMILVVLWFLAQAFPSPDAGGERAGTAASRTGLKAAALVLVAVTALVAVDNAAQVFWNRGRDAAAGSRGSEAGLLRAGELLGLAARLNPIHPGITKDAGKVAGRLYQLSGRPQAYLLADRYLARAARLNRNDAGVWGDRAALYGQLAARDDAARIPARQAAEEALQQARSLAPTNVFVLMELARLAEEDGRPVAALAHVEEALTLEPEFTGAHRVRIRLFAVLYPGAVIEAEQAFRESRDRLRGVEPRNTYEAMLFADPGAG